MKRVFVAFFAVFFIFMQGCKTEHKLEVDVKPMQITIDVNIRIDRELEDFFGNLDKKVKGIDGATTEDVSVPAQ
ncbi:MAG: hypothetical protein ACUBOA_07580 [Candidatus Loosdrechtia sp.]|uniref:hypothetical protein n=1 Tax=Candidatus Loosdrechtia sp. TaxID=3101272 RepID=UPI003A610D9B|nr:MAG: hypothetical protein QY305_00780 [Candidatus Jettenia sp. AMX2]